VLVVRLFSSSEWGVYVIRIYQNRRVGWYVHQKLNNGWDFFQKQAKMFVTRFSQWGVEFVPHQKVCLSPELYPDKRLLSVTIPQISFQIWVSALSRNILACFVNSRIVRRDCWICRAVRGRWMWSLALSTYPVDMRGSPGVIWGTGRAWGRGGSAVIAWRKPSFCSFDYKRKESVGTLKSL